MTLEVRDLAVARGGVPVLAGLSFALSAGQALVLRGPNGAGKTTLLRTIAGLQPPLAGQIRGTEDRIAYAAHADGLKATLTVAENLRFWAELYGEKRSIMTVLEAFEIADLQDRLAGRLSAGQKRRLGLSRLLVTQRPIWILDEPTVSLDQASVALFARVLQDHLTGGGAALLATHVDLGFEAETLDITPFRAMPEQRFGASDEAFL